MLKNKKKYTLNTKRFLIFIGSIVAIVSLIIVIIACNKKIEISEVTEISKINANKHYKEILKEYEKEESKQKFLEDYNNIQDKVALYIINNSTMDEASFSNLILQINEFLSVNDFEKIELDVPTFWNGSWNVDNRGKVKFRFDNKKIEPSWIEDEDVKGIINKNT